MDSSDPPIFTALSTSARQLYLLLRCISFTSKAEIQITPEGLRFSAEEARVIQGLAFLEKSLFTSYTFNEPSAVHNNPHTSDDSTSETSTTPNFQVSLAALLETLQIFGIPDSTSSSASHSFRNPNGGFTSTYPTAFTTPALALHSSGGTCRISYHSFGSPLSITITEGGVTTICDLTTYEPASNYLDEGIPLQRDALTLKIIMRSTWLSDAITELANTNPTVLVINASSIMAPFFALEGQGGPFGDSTVEFMPTSTSSNTADSATPSSRSSSRKTPLVTETFSVAAPPGSHGRVRQRYKFDLIRKAARAMALASKVSVRQDRQGVLSLQFMIEIGGDGTAGGSRGGSNAYGGGVVTNGSGSGAGTGCGKVTFVDFRFVPLIDDEEDESGDEEQGTRGGSDEEL
jgi:cell cycle checkpoint protein